MDKVNLTIIATINPNGKEELTHYLEKVDILYKNVDAKSVSKYKITKSLLGDYTPSLISIMEFPNIKSLNDVFESEEYKQLVPYREKGFSRLEAYIGE